MKGSKFSTSYLLVLSYILAVWSSTIHAHAVQPEAQISISSNHNAFKPCLTGPNFLACPDSFTVITGNTIDVHVRTILGAVKHISLQSKTNLILDHATVVPSVSCSNLNVGDICTFSITGFNPPASGDVNVIVNNKVMAAFTLSVIDD